MCVHVCAWVYVQRETEKSSAFCVWGLPGSVQAVAARRNSNSNSNTCDTDELKSHMFNQHHFKKLLHSLVAVLANYFLKGEFILSRFNVAEQVVTVTFTSQSFLSLKKSSYEFCNPKKCFSGAGFKLFSQCFFSLKLQWPARNDALHMARRCRFIGERERERE